MKKILVSFLLLLSFVYGDLLYVKHVSQNTIELSKSADFKQNVYDGKNIKIYLDKTNFMLFKNTKLKKRDNGSLFYVGKNDKALLYLNLFNEDILASIQTDYKMYKIYQKNEKIFLSVYEKDKIITQDAKDFVKKEPKLKRIQTLSSNPYADKGCPIDQNSCTDCKYENSKLKLDLLAFYTDDFKTRYSDYQTRIQQLVDMANEVFDNSNLDIELNLIGLERFEQNPKASIENALDLFNKSLQVRALKRKHKAHFVSLFRPKAGNSAASGLGHLSMRAETFLSTTYNVIDYFTQINVVGGYYIFQPTTLIHEIGHNFGCDHDSSQWGSGQSGFFSYASGYDAGLYGTVMSYNANTLKYFSSETQIDEQGRSLGNSLANNTKAINKTKYCVASQFDEKLEPIDKYNKNTKTISGKLDKNIDQDTFKLKLKGQINFNNTRGLVLRIYDQSGKFIATNLQDLGGNRYRPNYSLSTNLPEGYYDLVFSTHGDKIGVAFDSAPLDYSVRIQGDVISSTPPSRPKYTFSLKKDWNLIALDKKLKITLDANINDAVLIVKTYENGRWKTWDKNSNSNTLQNLVYGKAYWIKSSKTTSFEQEGVSFVNTPSTPTTNWQLLGSQNISDLDEFLQAQNAKIIWTYENGAYKAYSNDAKLKQDLQKAHIPSFSELKAKQGFWLK